MDGDLGGAQETVKLLANEAGLSFIRDVADRNIPLASVTGDNNLWREQIKPLFHLITHPLVIDSAVLEQHVAIVFNFLYGVGGDRMARVFSFVVRLLEKPSSETNNPTQAAAVELALAVLSKLLDCNTSNLIDSKFTTLAGGLSKCLKKIPQQPGDEFSRLQSAKHLEYILLRLNVGEEISSLASRPSAAIVREQFQLRRDLPGALCVNGPRHDNDHAAISDIKILPTRDEITSTQAEYLPTVDPKQWHLQGIRGRLDREFRLLREDTVGQLRDAVRETLESMRNPRRHGDGLSNQGRNTARTYTYDFPTPEDVSFDRMGGLELLVRCHQPAAVRSLSAKKRKEWWMQTKRLQAGALVCLLSIGGSVMFCVVSETTMRNAEDTEARRRRPMAKGDPGPLNNDQGKMFTLSDDSEVLFVRLQLVDPKKHDLGHALRWYQNVGPSQRRCLVEFPGILLASFKDTLAALQRMYQQPNIPFSELIAPTENNKHTTGAIERPRYTTKTGFSFDLGCLTTGKKGPFSATPQSMPKPEEVTAKTTLDPTQAKALINTLSRGLSLIQGPPGTGKSYTGEKIIRVLLANKKKADLGPILCVCYTNHALDQLLEHLLDDGVEKLIRIGSRSKSDRLQDLNLRTVAQSVTQTKSEKQQRYATKESISSCVKEIEATLGKLARSSTWRAVKEHLAAEHPRHYAELFPVAEENGWETVNHQPDKNIDRWLSGGVGYCPSTNTRLVEHLNGVPLFTMAHDERRLLYRHWLKEIRDACITDFIGSHQEFTELSDQNALVRREQDLRCLQQADVVGVTTTGLARNLDLLRRLRCKVMLCEEAGEVLEAHILTALLPSVEHAILIGDHLQLRPQIQNYELQSTNPRGAKHSLDMSLFERLVAPPDSADMRIPFSILETQRRMHPSIAELVRSTLYPSLKDAEGVSAYPEVVGMRKRLFWFHHEHLEARAANNDPSNTSQTNDFEVQMTIALVSHLVRQGEYAKTDIAVITPYLGQLQLLRRHMDSMFELCLNDRDIQELEAFEADSPREHPARPKVAKTTLLKSVRIATVDNFQGEEAKVVVISLVRSNPQNNCGFLRTPNRINVLLSRAKHGMYIIGNANACRSIPMWDDVIRRLQADRNFGTSLELQCPRHPDTPLAVSHPDHFITFSPESGCLLKCEKRLHCGHSCPGRCHSDVLHDAVKCLEDCPRAKKGCDHACPLRCGEQCHAKCQTKLEGVDLALSCGHHVDSVRCWEAQEPALIRCMREVTRNVPGCEHAVRVPCFMDVNKNGYVCKAVCGQPLPCGHTCRQMCWKCNPRDTNGQITDGVTNHGTCTTPCGRKYSTCPHSCMTPCHGGGACPPCKAPCDVRCQHSRCSKLCHEPCAPCAEQQCHSSCVHSQCTMPCAAPCNWVPCSKRCTFLLECGHQCEFRPGLNLIQLYM